MHRQLKELLIVLSPNSELVNGQWGIIEDQQTAQEKRQPQLNRENPKARLDNSTVQALVEEKELVPLDSTILGKASSLANSKICHPTALKKVEQGHLAHQQLEANKKHDMKLRDSASKLEELLPAQPPLTKPAHITPATGSTTIATKNTAHSSTASINYNSVEKATIEEKQKMQGPHDCLQMETNRSIEMGLRKRLSEPEKLLGSLVDQAPPIRTAHTVMTSSKEGESQAHPNSGNSSTPLGLTGMPEDTHCKDKPHWREITAHRWKRVDVVGLIEDMGVSCRQKHKGAVGNNPAMVEDLRVQELIQDLSLVEAWRGCIFVNGDRKLGTPREMPHPC